MARGSLPTLLRAIRRCRLCEAHLPLGARPVLQAGRAARLLIIGQAPGLRVHGTGTPWGDRSGDRLREWLGVDFARFYDETKVALVPTGFCYPGRGTRGDLPPRPECAPTWHGRLLPLLERVELTLLVGAHAQQFVLGAQARDTLTATVRAWRDYAPAYFVLPHPSPRNQIWLHRNAWFARDLLPELRRRVRAALQARERPSGAAA